MKKTKFSHRALAMFLTLTFLPSLLPVNMLFASNNGPTAPEAASFEPVDATDMVNLATGDLSYVLPLLNVPSPEGGYPLALSYHAGIAMDQEASWVGLGWNLNPGAINRSVNGFPDDWGETNFDEILYDRGGTESVYNFSIGGTLPNGITIGLSKSWGAQRSWGGVVGYAGNTFNFGSQGIGVGVGVGSGIGPLSINSSTNRGTSIALGYMPSNTINADTGKPGNPNGLGFSLGYNFSSNDFSLSTVSKKQAIGTSLSSQNGFSINAGGISNSRSFSSATVGDYYINTINKGFGINAGLFWIGYQHTQFEYSLFKNTHYTVNGTLYPYEVLDIDANYRQSRNNLMDVKQYYVSDTDVGSISNPAFDNYETLTFPNYDNYMVNAQGLSGGLSPRLFEEVPLFNLGDADDFRYLVPSMSNTNIYNLGNKIHFYLDNTNSSTLRIQTGVFEGPSINDPYTVTFSDVNDILFNHDTAHDNTFDSSFTPEGYLKTDGVRKRDGTFVETFTNEQILNNNTGGYFIEGKDFVRDLSIHKEQAIGAYRITTTDGKTYHYSIPVMHFESFNKNFKEVSEIDDKFFESRKQAPYATHWLLTAVTGADYVDSNSNGEVDEQDYGYWVEFEYGKWSDGYVWRSPKTGYHEIPNATQLTGNNGYKFFWGRKQIYYLDKVKTRTHTALFIKSVREDNKSADFNEFEQFYTGAGNFVPSTNSKIYDDQQVEAFASTLGPFYTASGNTYTPSYGIYYGKQRYYKYIEAPETRTLKLDKIILVRNQYDNTNKGNGDLLDEVDGWCNFNQGYIEVSGSTGVGLPDLFFEPVEPKFFGSHFDYNILDVKDIEGSNVESNAQKVIEFEYDYLLAQNSPNSDATNSGRLTLKNLQFAGKQGVALTPPYQFAYNGANSQNYSYTNQDVWGYHNHGSQIWSLEEIITPTGGKITIAFEKDSFYAEAAYRDASTQTLKDYTFSTIAEDGKWEFDEITGIEIDNDEMTIYFDTSLVSENFANSLLVGSNLDVFIGYKEEVPAGITDRSRNLNFTVIGTNQNNWIKLKANNFDSVEFIPEVNCLQNGGLPTNTDGCLKWVSFAVLDGIYTDSDPNGKTGGGIRVKSITINDNTDSYTTAYDYKNPITNAISGITSYEPFEMEKNVPYIEELPAPNVMYEYVTVSNLDRNGQTVQKTRYQHEVLTPYNLDMAQGETHFSLGEAFKVIKSQSIGNDYTSFDRVYKYTLYNKLSNLGRLKSMKVFNAFDQLISSTTNHFKHYSDNDELAGIIQESFKTYSRHGYQNQTNPNYNVSSSSRVEFPSVVESTITVNDGFKGTAKFLKYDFLSGKTLETEMELSNGNKIKTEIVPAYNIPVYSYDLNGYAMGAMVDDLSNKNMLTQEAMNKTYIWTGSDWELTSAGITTWNNNWTYTNHDGTTTIPTAADEKIWRKHKTYVWDGDIDDNGFFVNDGVLNTFSGDDDNFNWSLTATSQPSNADWKQLSETTQYDWFSMPLETQDINGNHAATKTCDKDTKIMATANAAYNEMHYSGAEYVKDGLFDGAIDDTGRTSSRAHTGEWCIGVSSVQGFKTTLSGHDAGRYKISVWASKEHYQNARVFDGNSLKEFNGEIIPAGDWVLLNHYVYLNETDKTIYVRASSGTIYYDDFRIHPVQSSMTSYVYNQWDELTHILGSNNMATRFEYDTNGRLLKTHTEVVDDVGLTGGFKTVSENHINYKTQ